MPGQPDGRVAPEFDGLRPRLLRIAYRMLGSIADAEDMVQEAFVRWMDTDRNLVREPGAFLRKVVTRLCIDHLKSARHRRESYVGPWLPEPILGTEATPHEDVTLPLLMALERLSPLERAAFLLHDVFGASFDEIAETIGREAAACRQLASRARAHVRAARPRFPLTKDQGRQIARAFFAATRTGDLGALQSLLAADVAVYADGGGKVGTTKQPVLGRENVIRLHERLARIFANTMSRVVTYGDINGLPGFVSVEQERTLQTTALAVDGGKIVAIYVTRNPDKLRHLSLDLGAHPADSAEAEVAGQ